MDDTGTVGFLECMFWQSRFFFWTFSVSSTYNIVVMTVERLVIPLIYLSLFDGEIWGCNLILLLYILETKTYRLKALAKTLATPKTLVTAVVTLIRLLSKENF